MNSKLEDAIRSSRDRETCYPKSVHKRSPDNPSLWQCAVTALVIQDYIWWEILFCLHNRHYRNRLPDWKIIDLTREQFSKYVFLCIGKVIDRDSFLKGESAIRAKTNERYQLLKNRIEKKLNI